MKQFLWGALAMACFVVGLFFLRYWKEAHDRLLLLFAIAFFLLGLSWVALASLPTTEYHAIVYAVRAVAFVVILIAIWDKNRRPR